MRCSRKDRALSWKSIRCGHSGVSGIIRHGGGRLYLAETDHLLALRLGSQRRHLSVLPDMDSSGLPYCRIHSDLCHAGDSILSARTHRAVDKEADQMAHQERWYNTLRS